MLRTRENSDVFNSLDEIYLVFTSKKQISSIYIPTSLKQLQNGVGVKNSHEKLQASFDCTTYLEMLWKDSSYRLYSQTFSGG